MRKLILCTLLASLALTANEASARNVWRECGIGGMIFQKTGWAAITSNIIWDLGTTATTSNISSDDLCEGKKASTAHFINETYANIEEEMAVGEGAHLTAMLNMLGCDNDKHAGIISDLRTDLSSQMSQASYSQQTKSQNAEHFFNTTLTRAHSAQCREI